MNKMKCSSSLTSLESFNRFQQTPEGHGKFWKQVRQCHTMSSRKSKRAISKKWRRSWTNGESSTKEFWRAVQNSLQELASPSPDERSIKKFMDLYASVCDRLNNIQVEGGKCEGGRSSEVVMNLAHDLNKRRNLRTELNERAKKLMKTHPLFKGEFLWRMEHLNSQWAALEKILMNDADSRRSNVLSGKSSEYDHKWLQEWLRSLENELPPLDFKLKWTLPLVEKEIQRYKRLEEEIQEKSGLAHAALRGGEGRGGRPKRRTSDSLNKRWLQLRLRVTEWVQHLSGVQQQLLKTTHQGKRKDSLVASEFQLEDSEEDSDFQQPWCKYRRIGEVELDVSTNDLYGAKIGSEGLKVEECEKEVSGLRNLENLSLTDDPMGQHNKSDAEFDVRSHHEDSTGSVASSTCGMSSECERKKRMAGVDGTGKKGIIGVHGLNGFNSRKSGTGEEDEEDEDGSCALSQSSSLGWQQPSKNVSTYYFKYCSSSEGEEGIRGRGKAIELQKNKRNCFNSNGDEKHQFSRVAIRTGKMEGCEDAIEKSCVTTINAVTVAEDRVQVSKFNESTETCKYYYYNKELEAREDLEIGQEQDEKKGGSQERKCVEQISAFERRDQSSCRREGMMEPETKKLIEKIDKFITPGCGGDLWSSASEEEEVTMIQNGHGVVKNVKGSSNKRVEAKEVKEEELSGMKGLCEETQQSLNEQEVTRPVRSGESKRIKNSKNVEEWISANKSINLAKEDKEFLRLKNTSSCDASAESMSETESSMESESEGGCSSSSDEPYTVIAFLPHCTSFLAELKSQSNRISSSSSGNNESISGSGQNELSGSRTSPVTLRRKGSRRGSGHSAKRPVSFSGIPSRLLRCSGPFDDVFKKDFDASNSLSPVDGEAKGCFKSESAINFSSGGGNRRSSGSFSSGSVCSGTCSNNTTCYSNDERKPSIRCSARYSGRRRNSKGIRSVRRKINFDENEDEPKLNAVLPDAECTKQEDSCAKDMSTLKPVFKLGAQEPVTTITTAAGEEIHGAGNDQDWDSYQEKYNSEPYSEEPFDPDRTAELLAFGEDYENYLAQEASLSSMESTDCRKRLEVKSQKHNVMESDSDFEDFIYLVKQSTHQLRVVHNIFVKASANKNDKDRGIEYAELRATCETNINAWASVLTKANPDEIQSIEEILEKWHILEKKISIAGSIQNIHEKVNGLKKNFRSMQSRLKEVDPFDVPDLSGLENKMSTIELALNQLQDRRNMLQYLNEESLGAKLYLEDSKTVSCIQEQIEELYRLYEENYQLGSFLLSKMKFLYEAWEKFEQERNDFEKMKGVKRKLNNEYGINVSSDSGHGTDFSHDSSISDSDMEFQERKRKLAALRKRACDIREILPSGSPVLSVIDKEIDEAEKGFNYLQRCISPTESVDVAVLYQKRKSFQNRKGKSMKYSKLHAFRKNAPKSSSRKWTVILKTIPFTFVLMGFFVAAAYWLQPNCCEYSNTFCLSLVPHLTHETVPPI